MKQHKSRPLKASGPEDCQSRVLETPAPQSHPSRLDKASESGYQASKNLLTHIDNFDNQDDNRTYNYPSLADQSRPLKASSLKNHHARLLENHELQSHQSRPNEASETDYQDSKNLVKHGDNSDSQDDNTTNESLRETERKNHQTENLLKKISGVQRYFWYLSEEEKVEAEMKKKDRREKLRIEEEEFQEEMRAADRIQEEQIKEEIMKREEQRKEREILEEKLLEQERKEKERIEELRIQDKKLEEERMHTEKIYAMQIQEKKRQDDFTQSTRKYEESIAEKMAKVKNEEIKAKERQDKRNNELELLALREEMKARMENEERKARQHQISMKVKEQGMWLQFLYNIVKMILLFFFGYILIMLLNKLKLVEMYYQPLYWNDGSDEDLETEAWRKKSEM